MPEELLKPGCQAVALDLNDVILRLRPLIERLFAARMKLEYVLDDAAGVVCVDRERLEHTLLRLLVNAREALRGAGHVTISTSLVPADERGEPRYVCLAVSDTGNGMTDEVRAGAFDDFRMTSTAAAGTGLSSVRRFARESGGTVTLDSAPVRGTTVTLILPRVGGGSSARLP